MRKTRKKLFEMLKEDMKKVDVSFGDTLGDKEQEKQILTDMKNKGKEE